MRKNFFIFSILFIISYKNKIVMLIENYYFCELTNKHLNKVVNMLAAHYRTNVEQIANNLENFKTHSFIMNPCEHESHSFKLPVTLVLVRKRDEKLVGTISINSLLTINLRTEKTERIAYLQGLYVEKDSRGFGIGKTIMNYSELYLSRLCFQQTTKLDPMNNLVECNHVYLSTRDKQFLYESINYLKTEPPIIISSASTFSSINELINDKIITNLMELYKKTGLKVNHFWLVDKNSNSEEKLKCSLVETCWFKKKIKPEKYRLNMSSI